jgi:8-oxo-dGTP pyrophosphatase MutT (NUDIX family)
MSQDYQNTLKEGVVHQAGALCFRQTHHGPEFLLITTRETGRWMIPKGWLIDGLTLREVAEREAWEEAGVVGKAKKRPIGEFNYTKVLTKGRNVPACVSVFLLKVRRQRNHYPEMRQRALAWLSPNDAAARVGDTELKSLVLRGGKIVSGRAS